ncbi:MAG: hypothetical protein MJZ93_06285 [Paludibacteraceae bacterium]|nr:hypothetical protein [Paludibacteraceae bacterium]
MKKFLFVMLLSLSVGAVFAATQPKMNGKVLKSPDGTYLDFNQSSSTYSYSDGSNTIVRRFTWQAKLLGEMPGYRVPVYQWQLTVSVETSNGTKNIVFYIKTYEDGSLKDNSILCCSNSTMWDVV